MGLPALVSQDAPGRFGPYDLVEQLGQGGMAVVYRARQRGHGGFSRDVVLKAMLPALVKSAPLVEMFESEARLTAQLRHPNIVQVQDFGVAGGIPYLIMEFLDGKNLSQLRNTLNKRKRLVPVGAAVSIVRDLCYALGYAHHYVTPDGKRMQVIHRDVSPSNVMVLRDGSVRLLDFGVAKLSSEAGQAVTSSLKGKFAYMAPEQVNQEPIDRRCDVFAAGIVLHELLTGRRLFGTKSELETLRRVSAADAATPSTINPAVPPALDAIVMRALRRRREDRFDSGTEMAAALDGLKLAFQRSEIATVISQVFPMPVSPGDSRPIDVEGDTEVSNGRRDPLDGITSPEHAASAPHLILLPGDAAIVDDEEQEPSVSVTAGDPVEIVAEPSSSRLALASTLAAGPPPDRDFEQRPTSVFDAAEAVAAARSTALRTARPIVEPAVVVSPSITAPQVPVVDPALLPIQNGAFDDALETKLRPMALHPRVAAIGGPAPGEAQPSRAKRGSLFLAGGLLGAALVIGVIGARVLMRAPRSGQHLTPRATSLAPGGTELAAPARVEPSLLAVPPPAAMPPPTRPIDRHTPSAPEPGLVRHVPRPHERAGDHRDRPDHVGAKGDADLAPVKPAGAAKPTTPDKSVKPKTSVKEGRIVDPFDDGG